MPVKPGTHKAVRRITIRHNPAPTDDRHISSTQRGYNYRWQKARADYLRKHPLCAECSTNKRVSVATELDHIVPHRGDMVLFWDPTNWQGLCKPCHSSKTAREDGGFGNRPNSKKSLTEPNL